MIINIRDEASGEERAMLMALLCRITGNSRPIAPTSIDGREVIALDGSQVDTHTEALLAELGAVENITRVKTPYKLVSRAFKPGGSTIVPGGTSGGPVVTLGPSVGNTHSSPGIIAA